MRVGEKSRLAHADVQSNGWVGKLLCDRLFRGSCVSYEVSKLLPAKGAVPVDFFFSIVGGDDYEVKCGCNVVPFDLCSNRLLFG